MTQHIFTISEESHKTRLDKVLAGLLVDVSRSRVQNFIKKGDVTVNGEVVDNISTKVFEGDEVEVKVTETTSTDIVANDEISLDIVYQDDDLLVINKQSGLTVHPGVGNHQDTMVNALIANFDKLSGVNGEVRPGIVHRLDKETSGLIIVAKNDRAHQILAEAIQYREVTRIYHALVWNKPELNVGSISDKIGRSAKDRTKRAIAKGGKEALTHFKLIKSYFNGTLSLMECKLETGRTHQIRVHMEHRKMPLIGDGKYGGQRTIKKTGSITDDNLRSDILKFRRQALHARYISFIHPSTEEEMSFEVEYPEDLGKVLDDLEGFKDR